MGASRKQFVLLFLVAGYAFHFMTKFVLDQPPDAFGASPDQAAWQRAASTILAPFKIVLMGPVTWLQQDPDPPPPFRLILLTAYWALLAAGSHRLLPGGRRESDASRSG